MADVTARDEDLPWENPLDALIGYQLRRASAAMLADLAETIADLDLTPTTMSVLLLIEANPNITQSEIGRLLGIKRANMAPIAAGLADRGATARSAMDGRSLGLRLTARGGTLAREARRRVAIHEGRLAATLPAAERRQLLAALRLVRKAMRPGGGSREE